MYTIEAGQRRDDMKLAALPDQLDIAKVSVPASTDTAHDTWSKLLAKQRKVLPGRACDEFLHGLQQVVFPRRIPWFVDISARIEAATGWRLARVDGIVPDEEFFSLLAQRIFPSTDFIRKPEEIGYTPAPDIFHDLLGHVPLLTNHRFATFFEQFGKVGLKAFELNHVAKSWLPRIYWYTVEFGLIHNVDGLHIYGLGILSSPSEVLVSLSDQTIKLPFDLDTIAVTPYDIWHIQQKLFVIDSFDQLEQSFAHWAVKQNLM